jgi:hypothetical protein
LLALIAGVEFPNVGFDLDEPGDSWLEDLLAIAEDEGSKQ